jgi:lysozyme family protein
MAIGNFGACLKFTLQFEGGFVNDPDDPGGATNLGVTIGTLTDVLGRQATTADVKALTPRTVEPIYLKHYWNPVHGDDLPFGVDLAVFDFGVHSGPVRAVMALQRVLGVADDGKIGPITIAAASRVDPAKIVQILCAERLAFLSRLSIFAKFGKGLRNRVSLAERAALGMVAKHIGEIVPDVADA